MKRVRMLLVVQCLAMAAGGQPLTQLYCHDFGYDRDSLDRWDTSGAVALMGYPHLGDRCALYFFPFGSSADQDARIQRVFDDLEGWVVVRTLCASIAAPNLAVVGAGGDSSVTTVSLSGVNPRQPDGPKFAHNVHYFPASGGTISYFASAEQEMIAIHTMALYQLDESYELEPEAYAVTIERDTVTRGPDTLCSDCFRAAYRGIVMTTPFLLLHLALEDSARWPIRYEITDTLTHSGIATCYFSSNGSRDEYSVLTRPGVDTVDIVFRGLRDSMAYTPEQFALFALDDDDVDTSECHASAALPRCVESARQGVSMVSSSPHLFDIQGRRIPSPGLHSPHTSGIYLQSSPDGRRARVIAVDGR